MNLSDLNGALLIDTAMTLPNLGREGASYLSHIINTCDTLSNCTLFSQAGVEWITGTVLSDWFSDRLLHQFDFVVGYMSLVTSLWCFLSPTGFEIDENTTDF